MLRMTGLMLHSTVPAVRGVSFKPIHSLSGVYAGVILVAICSCSNARVTSSDDLVPSSF